MICNLYSQLCNNIMLQYGQITPQLAIKVLLQFDKAINQALATRVKSRLTFKVHWLNIMHLIVVAVKFRMPCNCHVYIIIFRLVN